MRSSRTCASISCWRVSPIEAIASSDSSPPSPPSILRRVANRSRTPPALLRIALAEQGLVGAGVGGDLEVVGGPARPVGDVEAVEPDALEHAELGEHAVHAASGREVPRLVQRDVEVVDDLRAAHLAQEVVGVAAGEHVLLEHEHAQPRLRHPRRRGEPAEPGPDDDHVPVRVDSSPCGALFFAALAPRVGESFEDGQCLVAPRDVRGAVTLAEAERQQPVGQVGGVGAFAVEALVIDR